MAMNLGMKTPKLFFVNSDGSADFNPDNTQYESGFGISGTWVYGGTAPTESQYLDLGIVLDEREEVTMGGIPLSLPGTGVNSRIYWAIGGKILRVTISGIIPDGLYVSSNSGDDSMYSGKSNASVFKYKLTKLIGYQDILDGVVDIHVVRYRRKMLIENTTIARWVLTSYSHNFIQGTRNLQYTITLDLSNNIGLKTNIATRGYGEVL